MKAKVFFGITAFCVAALLIGSFMSGGKEAKAFSTDEGVSYSIFSAVWSDNPSNDLYTGTSFTIFNVNPNQVITLGRVFIFEPDGTPHLWSGIQNVPIPSFGSTGFNMWETGLAKLPETEKGAFVVGITWDGQPGDIRITSQISTYQEGSADLMASKVNLPF
jgi:hypothetical protein